MNKKYIDGLVNKLLKETIEEKADNLVSKLKTNKYYLVKNEK